MRGEFSICEAITGPFWFNQNRAHFICDKYENPLPAQLFLFNSNRDLGAFRVAGTGGSRRARNGFQDTRSRFWIRNRENGMNEMHGKAPREAVMKAGRRTMKAGIEEIKC